jgi:hypothetical protein
VSTEKYADDILCYIIGKQTDNQLPQNIANGIDSWCIKNKMRLNAGKCKIIHIIGTKNKHICPFVSLNNQELEQVSSYKYLGVELNKDLDWNQQWRRVQSLTSSVPFLVKQLKRLGFEERILINVYRSLVLSHFNYSSPVLASTSAADKHDMQSFQKRILRIIGIKQEAAKEKYNIELVEKHIEQAALKKLQKVLADPKHQLTVKLSSINTRTGELKFNIAPAHTEKYNNSIIPKCLRILRDGTANMYSSEKIEKQPVKIASVQCQFCKRVFKGQVGLNQHKRLTECSAAKMKAAIPSIVTKNAKTKAIKISKSKPKDTPCPICLLKFAGTRGLAQHQRLKNCFSSISIPDLTESV